MTNHERQVSETSSHVGVGSSVFTCDHEGCNHDETRSLQEHTKHIEKHKVLSGGHECNECGEWVHYQELDDKDKPTLKQHNSNLVFHPKCAQKFFENKGFEVKIKE